MILVCLFPPLTFCGLDKYAIPLVKLTGCHLSKLWHILLFKFYIQFLVNDPSIWYIIYNFKRKLWKLPSFFFLSLLFMNCHAWWQSACLATSPPPLHFSLKNINFKYISIFYIASITSYYYLKNKKTTQCLSNTYTSISRYACWRNFFFFF